MSEYKEKHPLVSIIIPTYNSEQTIEACLKTIFDLDYPKDRYEVIIVDGFSKDKTLEIAKIFPVKILTEKRKTRSAACMTGIENAKGEYIALTDSDCTVAKDWLSMLTKALSIDKKIAAVGGPNDFDPTLSELSKIITSLTKVRTFVGGTRIGLSTENICFTNSTNGCNSAYRKSSILEVGNFIPEVVGAEELELEWRLSNAGYKIVFTPEAKIIHHKKFTWKSFKIWMYRMGISRACTTKLRWFEALKLRRLSPVSPPTVLLASAIPIIWLGIFGFLMINPFGFAIAETLLIFYGIMTIFTAVSVYIDMRDIKGAFLSMPLQIIGHIMFIYGWWEYFLKDYKSITFE